MNTYTRIFFGIVFLVTGVTPAYAGYYNTYAQQGTYCLYQNSYGECMVEQHYNAPTYNTYHYSAPTYGGGYVYYESQYRQQYYYNYDYNRYNRYDRYYRGRYDYDDRYDNDYRWERAKDDFFDYND